MPYGRLVSSCLGHLPSLSPACFCVCHKSPFDLNLMCSIFATSKALLVQIFHCMDISAQEKLCACVTASGDKL